MLMSDKHKNISKILMQEKQKNKSNVFILDNHQDKSKMLMSEKHKNISNGSDFSGTLHSFASCLVYRMEKTTRRVQLCEGLACLSNHVTLPQTPRTITALYRNEGLKGGPLIGPLL